MYFPAFFTGRPFDTQRVENPLDLSVKPMTTVRPDVHCDQLLTRSSLAPPMPLLDNMYFTQSSSFPYCSPSPSSSTSNHLALMPDLLQQSRDVLGAPPLPPFPLDPSYHHMRSAIAAATLNTQRSLFGHHHHHSVLAPHHLTSHPFSSTIISQPPHHPHHHHISLYSDVLLNEMSHTRPDKTTIFDCPLPADSAVATAHFSDHLQRVVSSKCSAPCCGGGLSAVVPMVNVVPLSSVNPKTSSPKDNNMSESSHQKTRVWNPSLDKREKKEWSAVRERTEMTIDDECSQEVITLDNEDQCSVVEVQRSSGSGGGVAVKKSVTTVCNSVTSQQCETTTTTTMTANNACKQLKDYKPVVQTNKAMNAKQCVRKETKTVEVQCDGPDWTPIVLPSMLRSKHQRHRDNKRCLRVKHVHSRSRSSSSTSSRKSSPERRRSHVCCDSAKSRKRSMLNCLVNSEGYIADKIKRPTEPNLFASDPSQLGREERAIQRAIKHFEELQHEPQENNATEETITTTTTETAAVVVATQETNEDHVRDGNNEREKTNNNNNGQKRSANNGCEKTKTKRKLRQKLLERLLEESAHEEEEEVQKKKKKQREKADGEHCRQKRVFTGVRRRRFRSGLDMIRHKRRRPRVTHNKGGREEEAKNSEEVTPKAETTNNASTEMKRILVNKALGETVLHRAARTNRQDVVNFCLQSNTCDVNARDNANYTPLHECSTRGHLEIARILLQNSADVNASAAGGIRPLHDAIENNHIEVVRLLLSYGADPNITTYSGSTPLQLSRSKAMTTFLKGFLSDISTERARKGSALLWKCKSWWSALSLEPHTTGFNVLQGVPSDGDECGGEEDEFVFEVSDTPLDPTYRLPHSRTKGSTHFLRLSDVLRRTRCRTREEFVKKHSNIEIVSIACEEFAKASIGQLVSSGVQRQRVDSSDHCFEELVHLNDHMRSILGIESVRVR